MERSEGLLAGAQKESANIHKKYFAKAEIIVGFVEKIPIRLVKYFSSKSKIYVIMFGFVSLFIVGVLDYKTGSEAMMFLLYLVPIVATSWLLDKNWAILFSMLSVLSIVITDLLSGFLYSTFLIALWNRFVLLGVFLTVSSILIVLKRYYTNECRLARSDMVTGVSNSRDFYEVAGVEMLRAKRYGRPVTVVYIDVDNFKSVNDKRGHDIGDDLLRLIALNIRGNIRVNDTIARMGGDEFMIFLPEAGLKQAKKAVNNIIKKLKKAVLDNSYDVTFSVGVVTCVPRKHNIKAIVKKADKALYYVKNHGKNGIKFDIL